MDNLIYIALEFLDFFFGVKQLKDGDQRTRNMSNLKYYIIVIIVAALAGVIFFNIWYRFTT